MQKSEIQSRAITNVMIKNQEDTIDAWEKRLSFIAKKPDDYIEDNLVIYLDEYEKQIPGVPPPHDSHVTCYYWAAMPRDVAVALLKYRIALSKKILTQMKKIPREDWKGDKTLAEAFEKGHVPDWCTDVPAFTNLNPEKGLLRIVKAVRTLNQEGKKPTHKEINSYLKENFGLSANNSETVAILTKCGIIKNFKPGYAVTDFGDEVLAAYNV